MPWYLTLRSASAGAMAAFENIQGQPQLDPRSADSMAACCARAPGHARSALERALASGSIMK